MSELTKKPASYAARLQAYIADEAELLGPFLRTKKTANTRKAYRRNLIKFFGMDEVYLSNALAVDPDKVNGFIADEEAGGLSRASIDQLINSVRSFYNWLDANRLIKINPLSPVLIAGVKTTRKKDRLLRHLSKDQARSLLAVAANPETPKGRPNRTARRDFAIILLMLHSGLRASEVVEMDARHVTQIDDRWIVKIPTAKSGSDQYVPIPSHVAMDLNKFIAGQSGPVFRSAHHAYAGQRLSEKGLEKIITRLGNRAGIDGLSPHILRHTFATLARDEGRGASLEVLKDNLRHSDIKTTAGYIHRANLLKHAAGDFIRL